MRFLKSIVLAMALLGVIGCGGSNETTTKVVVPPALELLKSELNKIASKGEPVGSGRILLQQYLDKITAEDASKAKALTPLLETLMTLKDPAKIKAKAGNSSRLIRHGSTPAPSLLGWTIPGLSF